MFPRCGRWFACRARCANLSGLIGFSPIATMVQMHAAVPTRPSSSRLMAFPGMPAARRANLPPSSVTRREHRRNSVRTLRLHLPAGTSRLGAGSPRTRAPVGRHRHGGLVRVHAGLRPRDPRAPGVLFALEMRAHRAAAMAEQPAQVGVATFADAQQPGQAAGAVLPGHQAEPGREIPPARALLTH